MTEETDSASQCKSVK